MLRVAGHELADDFTNPRRSRRQPTTAHAAFEVAWHRQHARAAKARSSAWRRDTLRHLGYQENRRAGELFGINNVITICVLL